MVSLIHFQVTLLTSLSLQMSFFSTEKRNKTILTLTFIVHRSVTKWHTISIRTFIVHRSSFILISTEQINHLHLRRSSLSFFSRTVEEEDNTIIFAQEQSSRLLIHHEKYHNIISFTFHHVSGTYFSPMHIQ